MRHPAHPFQVALATLKEGANPIRMEGSGEEAGITPSDVELEGPVVVEGVFFRAEAHVEVQAQVRAVAVLACDRCVAAVRQPIEANLRLLAEKRAERDHRTDAESRAEDSGLLYHDGRTLDLQEDVRDAVLLELPWHPLCSPDCKGLCPRCGKNKNEGDCGCPPRRGTDPWDLLGKMIEGGDATSTDPPRGKE